MDAWRQQVLATLAAEVQDVLVVDDDLGGSVRKAHRMLRTAVGPDGESARRSIEKLLQSSARRTGAINLVGANL